MLTVERTPAYATQMADVVSTIVAEIERENVEAITIRMREAGAIGDRRSFAAYGMMLLQVQFAIVSLSRHACNLRHAAHDAAFAQLYWRNVAIN